MPLPPLHTHTHTHTHHGCNEVSLLDWITLSRPLRLSLWISLPVGVFLTHWWIFFFYNSWLGRCFVLVTESTWNYNYESKDMKQRCTQRLKSVSVSEWQVIYTEPEVQHTYTKKRGPNTRNQHHSRTAASHDGQTTRHGGVRYVNTFTVTLIYRLTLVNTSSMVETEREQSIESDK